MQIKDKFFFGEGEEARVKINAPRRSDKSKKAMIKKIISRMDFFLREMTPAGFLSERKKERTPEENVVEGEKTRAAGYRTADLISAFVASGFIAEKKLFSNFSSRNLFHKFFKIRSEGNLIRSSSPSSAAALHSLLVMPSFRITLPLSLSLFSYAHPSFLSHLCPRGWVSPLPFRWKKQDWVTFLHLTAAEFW